ncbi:MAG: hypothetical protein PUH30_01395 [Oscillospiraceae bacterium]|nr:hypothetical protein [Oscillospiraceae bacterium]
MKKFDVTAYDNGAEVYDCEIIEANDEREAISVAEDMLDYAGYTADEIKELDLRVREIEE